MVPAGHYARERGHGHSLQMPGWLLASINGCRNASQPPTNQIDCGNGGFCPIGTECCGSMCCSPGNFCSRYGCAPNGAIECGNHYCNPGQQCSRSGGCQPAGSVDCGIYYCQPGERCASGHRACLSSTDTDCGGYHCSSGSKCSSAGCLPEEATDCGNRTYCRAEQKCSRDGTQCLPRDSVDCNSHVCGTDMKCGSKQTCIAAGAIDCGDGRSCPSGSVCRREGGCATQEELAAEKAAVEAKSGKWQNG